MEFDACGVYGGLWAFGDRFSGPGAYLSLTLGRTAWELAAEQIRSAVSWPSWVPTVSVYVHGSWRLGEMPSCFTARCGIVIRKPFS